MLWSSGLEEEEEEEDEDEAAVVMVRSRQAMVRRVNRREEDLEKLGRKKELGCLPEVEE